MTTNRLFNGFGLLVTLVVVGLLALPVAVGSLKVAPTMQALFGLAAIEHQDPEIQRFIRYADQISAAQARLDQRRGEWNAGAADIDVEQSRIQWRAAH